MPDPIEFPAKDPYARFSQNIENKNALGRFEVSLSEGIEKLVTFEVDNSGALITTIPSTPADASFLTSLASAYFNSLHENFGTIPESPNKITMHNGDTTILVHFRRPDSSSIELTLSNHRFKRLPYPINALMEFAIGARLEALPEGPTRTALDTALQERSRIAASI